MARLQSESPIIPTVVALPESNRWPLPLGGVSGVPVLIQSRSGNKGNFELLTPMASGGLAHYWRNTADPTFPWHGPTIFGQERGILTSVSFSQTSFGHPCNSQILPVVGTTLAVLLR